MPSNETPSVSVVVSLFNKSRYIAGCVESVCAQTHQNFELIVVDDGSTDGSGDIARKTKDPRVRVVTQINGGEGAARNRGIAEAKSELVAFLDGDDTWESTFLEAIVQLRQRYPRAGLLATGFRRCHGSDELDKEVTLQHADGSGHKLISNYFQQANVGDFVHSSSVAVPRHVFSKLGCFLKGEPTGCDRECWARIALRHPVAHDARILGRYNVGAVGRVCNEWAKKSKFPPVVRMLHAQIESKNVSSALLQSVELYSDRVLMNYSYDLLWNNRREEVVSLLTAQRFYTAKYRAEAQILRSSLKILPCRAILALKYKPLKLTESLRQNRRSCSGSRVITRPVCRRAL